MSDYIIFIPFVDTTKSEALTDTSEGKSDEDSFSYDFTSPVASFLEQSRKQVERYFRGEPANDVDDTSVKKQTNNVPSKEWNIKLEGMSIF